MRKLLLCLAHNGVMRARANWLTFWHSSTKWWPEHRHESDLLHWLLQAAFLCMGAPACCPHKSLQHFCTQTPCCHCGTLHAALPHLSFVYASCHIAEHSVTHLEISQGSTIHGPNGLVRVTLLMHCAEQLLAVPSSHHSHCSAVVPLQSLQYKTLQQAF